MAARSSLQFRDVTATFTRPNDTAVYAAGDLVANSTTAASVIPMSWAVPGNETFDIPYIKLRKAGTGSAATNALFRLHLFSVLPTIATTGDNGVMASVVTDAAGWLGSFDNSFMAGFANSCTGLLVPTEGVIKPDFIPPVAAASILIYGLLEARAAYTPIAVEVFLATLVFETRQVP